MNQIPPRFDLPAIITALSNVPPDRQLFVGLMLAVVLAFLTLLCVLLR